MADSPVFDRACSELERRTSLARLEARGTIRIGLKAAGLETASVDAAQMTTVLRRVLPDELARRGVADGGGICEAIAKTLAGEQFDVAVDRAGSAAATIGRFGG